jgi:type III secretory pathway component EscR
MGLGEDIKRGFLYGLGFFGAFLVILIVLSLILLVFAMVSGSQMSPTPSPSSGG